MRNQFNRFNILAGQLIKEINLRKKTESKIQWSCIKMSSVLFIIFFSNFFPLASKASFTSLSSVASVVPVASKNKPMELNQTKYLSKYFKWASQVASEGSSLEFFSFSEKIEIELFQKSVCKKVYAIEVKNFLSEVHNIIIEEVIDSALRLQFEKLYTEAKKEWDQFVDEKMKLESNMTFLECRYIESNKRSLTYYRSFIGQYLFLNFSWAYED